MANNPSQLKPVFQTADVPAGHTVTPASEIPKTTIRKKEKQMYNDFKTHYLMGFKDGLEIGIDKGYQLAEAWSANTWTNCPNTTPMLVESVPYTEEIK